MEHDEQISIHAAKSAMHRRRFLAWAGGLAGTSILTACGGTGTATAPATPASSPPTVPSTVRATPVPGSVAAGASSMDDLPVLMIEAFDYGYRSLGSIAAGSTRFQLRNTGKDDHHGQLIKLNAGVTVAQVEAALEGGPKGADAMVTYAGGPGGVTAGGSTEVILDLPEGQYLLLCFLRGADHLSHFTKGMRMPLTVSAPVAAPAPAPAVNGTITMFDFNFTMPDTLPAGRSMYTVTNTGAQYHEFAVARLLPGKTADDFKAFFDPAARGGPPPGVQVGGMQGLTRGNTGIVVLNLTPGDYVALCSAPDQSMPQGAAHAHLGMVKAFTVR